MVIGVILENHKEGWRVDIGCAESAQLNQMSFEGATKKNRAHLPVCPLSPEIN